MYGSLFPFLLLITKVIGLNIQTLESDHFLPKSLQRQFSDSLMCPIYSFRGCDHLVQELMSSQSNQDKCCLGSKLVSCYESLRVDRNCENTKNVLIGLKREAAERNCDNVGINYIVACGLTTGMVVGIVFAVLVLLIIVTVCVVYFTKCRKPRVPRSTPPST